MLKIESNSSVPLQITQINTEPAVYLDHWALRKITASPKLSERLRNDLTARNGQLEVSWLNLLEFSEVSVSVQVKSAESFLESISPEHIGFINVSPEEVIALEDKCLRREKDAKDPHLDYRLFEIFASRKTSSLRPVSFEGFLSNQNARMQEMSRTFMESLSPTWEQVRMKAKDPRYAKALRTIPAGHPQVQHLTRYIYLEILRSIARDGGRMHPRHWRDMFHAIVPLAYCDLVLLDKAWVERVNKAKSRLRKRGHTPKMAEVFWEGTLDGFWRALEEVKPPIGQPELPAVTGGR